MSRTAGLQFDGTTSNSGTGGTVLRQTSSDSRPEIAGLRWEHEPVMCVGKQAERAGGIVGYPVFEGKVAEIDFDRMIMTIHDTLPAHTAGFARTPMPFPGSLPAVESALVNGGQRAIRGDTLRPALVGDDRDRGGLSRIVRGEIQKGLGQADTGRLLDGPAVMAEMRELIKNRRP